MSSSFPGDLQQSSPSTNSSASCSVPLKVEQERTHIRKLWEQRVLNNRCTNALRRNRNSEAPHILKSNSRNLEFSSQLDHRPSKSGPSFSHQSVPIRIEAEPFQLAKLRVSKPGEAYKESDVQVQLPSSI